MVEIEGCMVTTEKKIMLTMTNMAATMKMTMISHKMTTAQNTQNMITVVMMMTTQKMIPVMMITIERM